MYEDQAPADHSAPTFADELPPPAPRRHLHTRAVIMQGFRHDDGLWDIEGEMKDCKTAP